jgi:hypothetical protein
VSAHGRTTHTDECGCVYRITDTEGLGQGWIRVAPCRAHAGDVCVSWTGSGTTIHHCHFRPGHTVRHTCPCGLSKAAG